MTDAPWHVRPYRPGDERTLVSLWTEAFGKPMSEAHWRWKAKGRSAAVENVGIAVAADDRPIFQFVGIPCPAIVLGTPRTVMIGADVVTDPAFRRRGVFPTTARRLFDSWRDAGVALVLGLANDRWRAQADALGYERFFPMRRLVRILRPERLLARRAHVPGLARLRGVGALWNLAWDRATPPEITVRPLATASPEIDSVWQRANPHVQTSLVRDRTWVAWRYCDCPYRTYHLMLAERTEGPVGYAVHSVVRANGTATVLVPEIFAPGDRAALRALVRAVVERGADEDADTVVAHAIPGTALHRELRRAGFLDTRSGWPVEVIQLDPTLPRAALRDPSGWWLVAGDFDVI
jgi:hypothetical protein